MSILTACSSRPEGAPPPIDVQAFDAAADGALEDTTRAEAAAPDSAPSIDTTPDAAPTIDATTEERPVDVTEPDAASPDGAVEDRTRPDVAIDVVAPESGVDAAAPDATRDAIGPDASPAAPVRLIAPMSTSEVSSTQPSLRWAPAGGASVEIELCRDRTCATPQVRLSVAAGVATVRPTAPLSPGWWFWRARIQGAATYSPTWQFHVRRRGAAVDTRWGTTLDLNGDGYADLAVAAPSARASRGTVSIYYGGPTGPSALANVVLEGTVANARDRASLSHGVG